MQLNNYSKDCANKIIYLRRQRTFVKKQSDNRWSQRVICRYNINHSLNDIDPAGLFLSQPVKLQ